MNTREIAILIDVVHKIRAEYERNQKSNWFDHQYAEGLSVASQIVHEKIKQLQQEQEHAARTENLQRAG